MGGYLRERPRSVSQGSAAEFMKHILLSLGASTQHNLKSQNK
jgi:hypothetical protein